MSIFDTVPDYSGDEAETNRLAARVRAYWSARGRNVNVWVEPHGNDPGRHFAVRSNIVFRVG